MGKIDYGKSEHIIDIVCSDFFMHTDTQRNYEITIKTTSFIIPVTKTYAVLIRTDNICFRKDEMDQ